MLLPACGILLLILDSKTAIAGAAEGIELCLRSVIPSLFPFFMLSILLTNALSRQRLPFPKFIGKICGLPQNAEGLFLIGLLGGYPVGAQAVADAYRSGSLSKVAAQRLLGFCSNAGPAFIFGISGCLFSKQWIPWIIWLIHILSAVSVGAILPAKTSQTATTQSSLPITVQQAFKRSLRSMASVSGWIILFRILISFLDRWFLWLLPQTAGIFIAGCLELANGIFALQSINSEPIRFILCSTFLGFGGVCVSMQTASVTGDLGTGLYFPGKMLQGVICCSLSAITALFIYDPYTNCGEMITIPVILTACMIVIIRIKKIAVAFSGNNVYNSRKSSRELPLCSFERK